MAYMGSLEAAELEWCQPWLRVSLLIRVITNYQWDAETWLTAKGMLAKALAIRGEIQQAARFN